MIEWPPGGTKKSTTEKSITIRRRKTLDYSIYSRHSFLIIHAFLAFVDLFHGSSISNQRVLLVIAF